MRPRLTFFLILIPALCAQDRPRCAPSAEIDQILRPPKPDPSVNHLALLEKTIAAHPDDFHLLAEYLVRTAMDVTRPERARLADRLRVNPQGAPAEALAALSWLGVETPKAIEGLKAAQAKDPDFPWSGYYLAAVYSYPKFRDNKQGAELAAAFLKVCPDYLPAYSYVSRVTMPDIQRPLAAQLRARLESPDLPPRDLNMYSTLWTLEFRATPVNEHAPLRERVAKDIARIKTFDADPARMASLERTAAQLAGDNEAMKQAESRLRGASGQGLDEFMTWQKEYPHPGRGATQIDLDAYETSRRQKIAELTAKYPDNPALRDLALSYALMDKSKTGEELTSLAAEYLKDRDGQASSPYKRRRVARLWLERDINLDQVPGLLEQAAKLQERQSNAGKTDLFDMSGAYRPVFVMQEWIDYWTLVLLYENKRGNREGMEKASAEIERHIAANKPKSGEKDINLVMSYWSFTASYYQQRADIAEKDRRMLDALAWLRKTIEADRQRPTPIYSREDSLVMKKSRELWAAVGGSPETYSVWFESPPAPSGGGKPIIASIGLPPKELSLALPAMDLKDMEGKTWTLANIKGRATLINFWATWCGPCRDELPYLQKLYNQTQERQDLRVITLNMDDNPGVIEPFLKQNNYTFPVLLAKDYAEASLKIQGIPTNYVTDSNATVILEYLGFGPNGDAWIKQMLAALEENKRADNR